MADLARGLAARGHEIFAALPQGSPLRAELAGTLRPENFLELPLRNALDVRSALRLSRFLRERGVEVLHAHVARDYLPAALAARRAEGTALVITRHVLFPLGRVHRLALKDVASVIAVSEAVARKLRAQKVFPAEKIRVIHNGVDAQRFEAARSYAESQRRDSLLRVGIVGELSEVKGQEDFVRAAALVTARLREAVEFVIVGEDASPSGQTRALLEGLIGKLGLERCVRLEGRREDVAGLLHSFDLLVSASHTEAFGMAMVEAMACGVPVVATATEGAREIIEDAKAGLLVPIGDVEAIAAAVESLLRDAPRRSALGARAREIARQRFSLQRMIEETERVYAEAQARGKREKG